MNKKNRTRVKKDVSSVIATVLIIFIAINKFSSIVSGAEAFNPPSCYIMLEIAEEKTTNGIRFSFINFTNLYGDYSDLALLHDEKAPYLIKLYDSSGQEIEKYSSYSGRFDYSFYDGSQESLIEYDSGTLYAIIPYSQGISSIKISYNGVETDLGIDSSKIMCEKATGDIDDCTNLNVSGAYNLSDDIIINSSRKLSGPCINVSAEDVTLDCRGHLIKSDDNVAGVYSNQPGTTVKNCRIDMGENYEIWVPNGRYGKGIELSGANNSVILNNTLNGQGYGLYIYSASGVRAEGNSFDSNAEGIYMKSSSGNALINNRVNSSGSFGVLLINSMNNTLIRMTVKTNGQGITLDASSGNILSDVVTNSNGYGMWLQLGSNENMLINVTSDNNSQGGLRLFQSSGNRITGSEFNSNDYEGIAISRSSGNVIENTRACFNTREDLKYWRSIYTFGYYDFSCYESSLNSGGGNRFMAATNCSDGWPVPGRDYFDCTFAARQTVTKNVVVGGNSFDFNGSRVVVDGIGVEVNMSMKNVTITVGKLWEKPSYVIADSPGAGAYAYLNITAVNLTVGYVVNVTINFSVSRLWLDGNGLDKNTITLYRYDNVTWMPLPTYLTGEDSDYVHYTAVTNHLTDFAISGDRMTGAQTGAGAAPGFAVTSLTMAICAAVLLVLGMLLQMRRKDMEW